MNLVAVLLFLWSLQTYADNQTEIPITYSPIHLQNTSSEGPKNQERLFDLLDVGHNIQVRNYPSYYIDTSNYALKYDPDGTCKLTRKDLIVGYKPQFNMSMVKSYQAPSSVRRLCSTQYETDSKYFANKFKGIFAEKVFHCFDNYRYPGFREYVKRLPGFDDFILSVGEHLKAASQLHQRLFEQDFAALKNIHQTKMYELVQKAQAKRQTDLRQNLRARDFSDHGIKLLEHHGIESQFLYDGNLQQLAQLKNITSFINDVGEFRHEYHKTPELNEISDSATGFGILANNANRENLPSTSQAFLEIGQNLLALGRGLVAGCVRNASGIYHMAKDPIGTIAGLGSLIKNIGIGIGDVAIMLGKNEIGQRLNQQFLIDSAQQDMGRYIDSARQIYQYVKQTWQDKSTIERYELVGNSAADLLLAKGLPVLAKLGPIKNLAQYKPIAFAKLGNIGREINQIAGLTCAKGAKAVQRGFEVVKNYPQIVQGQQLLGAAIYHGNKCLKVSNSYLKKLSKHAAKCAMDVERRLVKIGDQVKKLPKACIAKTKQLLGEEVVVTDTLGNVWRSKIGELGWATELSEQGQRAIALLNEVAGGLKGVAKETFQHYRTVPYGIGARESLNVMKWHFEALERELQILGIKFKDFYGAAIEGRLGNELIHFKGKAHLLSATIKRNLKASGIGEKITGLHWDFGRKLEQLGVYSLSDVEHLAGGMYKATLNYGGVVKRGKTFFPSHWDAKMLASKISEACHNSVKIFRKSDGILEITGMVEEGFQIIIKIGKRGQIITAYPDVAGKIL